MILIALGGNLPSRAGAPSVTLDAALVALRARGIHPVAVSPYYRTKAWPNPNDPEFVNAAACIETILSPPELVSELHAVESSFGRARGPRNAPRTLDLDLVDYDGRIEGGPPTLPHPRMDTRGFVLIPLRDIAPGWRHPVSGKTVDELIAALPEAEKQLPQL